MIPYGRFFGTARFLLCLFKLPQSEEGSRDNVPAQGFGDEIPNVRPDCDIFVKTEKSGKNLFLCSVIWL